MSLLTLDEARTFITTSLGDASLQLLLDAAEQAITDVAGPLGDDPTERVEIHDGGTTYLFLRRPATEITTVKEWLGFDFERDLGPTDYRLSDDSVSLRRLSSSTTPAVSWLGPVEVTTVPVNDLAQRKIAQVELCRLALNKHPGAQSETIGDWSESFSDSAEWAAARDEILASLVAQPWAFA